MRETTEASFVADVYEGEGIQVAYFTAPWCGPCRMLKPTLEKLEAANEVLTINRIDCDTESTLAAGFRIMTVPTLLWFRNGQLVDETNGVLRQKDLQDIVDQHKD